MNRVPQAFLLAGAAPSGALLLVAITQFALGVPHVATARSALSLLAITYPIEIVLGIPAHLLLARLRWRGITHYALAGAWIGAGGWCALVLPFDLPERALWPLLALWCGTSMACAALFWWVGVRTPTRR